MTSVRENWGLVCPNCGSDDSITVEVTTWVRLHEDGTDQVGDEEWTRASPCMSLACDTQGSIKTFTAPDQDGDQ